jgi:hypothetical protein
VEWTDGTLNPTQGGLQWYGLEDTAENVIPKGDTTREPDMTASVSGDQYQAIFSFDTNRELWPKALRFRYHVNDVSARLPLGRHFSQVVSLPD